MTEGDVEFLEHQRIVEGTLRRREYQVKIATKALGKPTLVVLPTGLGKTVVALIVIAERLKQGLGPVLMLAPTKPLVEQHLGFMRAHLKDARTVMLTGETPPGKRRDVYLDGDVVITTPQVVKNDIISGDLDLSMFRTLIVDEAHRSVGDYPYVFIAEMFYQKNQDGLVLGLTASPGHDVSRIYEVCKNLGIENIEVRVDSDPDVKPYIQELEVQSVKVEVSQGMRSLIQVLERMFMDRVTKLQRMGVVRKGSVTSVKELLGAASRIREIIDRSGKDGGAYYQAMSVQAQAMKVSHAVELAETQGAEAVFQYMDRLLKETSSPECSKATRAVVSDGLFNIAMNKASSLRSEPPPKVEALERFVIQKLREDPDARIIAFTHFRDTATLVLERLEKQSERGVHAVRFVGQATRDKDEGLSQKEQKEILDRFKEGKCNVLIATSVAEEGLDIPGADLVIFYEPIPSEIRTIQRRGRTGRHAAGKVVVLMSKETRDIAYSFSARDKEVKMERQLLALRRMLARMPLPQRALGIDKAPPGQESSLTLESFTEEAMDRDALITVMVDQREMASAVVEELSRRGVKLMPSPLGQGDYVISNRVALERKTAQDLSDSLIDGRLFDQAKRLREDYERALLVIEGDDIFNRRNISKAALLGALSSITAGFGIPTMFTRDSAETAEFIMALANQERKEGRRPRAPLPQKGRNLKDIQVQVLSGLPGVSTVLAERLLRRFHSLEGVFIATEKDLSEVDGIGRVKAKEIKGAMTGQTLDGNGP